MAYGILEESGETRRVGIAEFGDFTLELRVARPEYLLEGMTSPFYFNIFKNDAEDEEFMEGLTPYDGVPVRDVEDFRNKVKKHGKRLGIPSVAFNALRADIELNSIGIGKDFDDPHDYFIRTETKKQKSERETLDGLYESIKKECPDAAYQEINAHVLSELATEAGLPTCTLPGLPDYSKIDRKLTMDEIRDDMENRKIMAMTSPFGSNPHMIDHMIRMQSMRVH